MFTLMAIDGPEMKPAGSSAHQWFLLEMARRRNYVRQAPVGGGYRSEYRPGRFAAADESGDILEHFGLDERGRKIP